MCFSAESCKGACWLGLESQCMILAAEDNEGNVTVLMPEKDIVEGSKIG